MKMAPDRGTIHTIPNFQNFNDEARFENRASRIAEELIGSPLLA
jgi:hypothetical protein